MGIRRLNNEDYKKFNENSKDTSFKSFENILQITANHLPGHSLNFNCQKYNLDNNDSFLEFYQQRCRALEIENRRIMGNQGKIISESNKRMQVSSF